MASKHLNVLLDQELFMALQNHAGAAGMTLSQATRDLLRHALAVVTSTRDAGWREGYAGAYAEVQRVVLAAIAQVSPVLPNELQQGASPVLAAPMFDPNNPPFDPNDY